MYHPVETETEESEENETEMYRIVRFSVHPFSIAHSFAPVDDEDDDGKPC